MNEEELVKLLLATWSSLGWGREKVRDALYQHTSMSDTARLRIVDLYDRVTAGVRLKDSEVQVFALSIEESVSSSEGTWRVPG